MNGLYHKIEAKGMENLDIYVYLEGKYKAIDFEKVIPGGCINNDLWGYYRRYAEDVINKDDYTWFRTTAYEYPKIFQAISLLLPGVEIKQWYEDDGGWSGYRTYINGECGDYIYSGSKKNTIERFHTYCEFALQASYYDHPEFQKLCSKEEFLSDIDGYETSNGVYREIIYDENGVCKEKLYDDHKYKNQLN